LSEFNDNRTGIDKLAAEAACVLVTGAPNELLIDLDTDEQFQQFKKMLPHLREQYGVSSVEGYLSRHGNRHIVVTLYNPVELEERLFLQAVLGSDPLREFLSYRRVQVGSANPSVLFRPVGASFSTIQV
jgi:hypothetical protein